MLYGTLAYSFAAIPAICRLCLVNENSFNCMPGLVLLCFWGYYLRLKVVSIFVPFDNWLQLKMSLKNICLIYIPPFKKCESKSEDSVSIGYAYALLVNLNNAWEITLIRFCGCVENRFDNTYFNIFL